MPGSLAPPALWEEGRDGEKEETLKNLTNISQFGGQGVALGEGASNSSKNPSFYRDVSLNSKGKLSISIKICLSFDPVIHPPKTLVKPYKNALVGVAQWIECLPVSQSHWFNSQSGHRPGLWARSPVRGAWEATTYWSFSPSFSLPSPLLNKNFKNKTENLTKYMYKNINWNIVVWK